MVSADDKVVLEIRLSSGDCHDAPEGRTLISALKGQFNGTPLLMDRAHEGAATRELAITCGFEPVVPPKANRKNPWAYNKETYKRRNIVERLFRRIKAFRRVYTRYDKTDIMYLAFVQFALVAVWLN